MDEKSKGILLRCARIYFHTKNWPKALAEYANIAKECPEDPHLLEQMALCQANMNDKPGAKIKLTRAAEIEEAQGHAEKSQRLREKIAQLGL